MAARAHQATDDRGSRRTEEDCWRSSVPTGESQKGESMGCDNKRSEV